MAKNSPVRLFLASITLPNEPSKDDKSCVRNQELIVSGAHSNSISHARCAKFADIAANAANGNLPVPSVVVSS